MVSRSIDFSLFGLGERLIGRERAGALVRGWARLLFHSPRVRRSVGRNMRRILAHTSGREPGAAEVEAVVDEMAGLYGRCLVEHYTAPRDPSAYARDSEAILLDPLKDLLGRGRGVIVASPHFGCEGLLYGALAYHGIPTTVMLHDAGRYQWPTDILATLRFIGVGQGARTGLERLRRGEVLYLNDDLDYFPDGRTMPLFGAPFRPPHGVARMSLASGAPILPAYAVFESGRHRLLCDEPLHPQEAPSPSKGGHLPSTPQAQPAGPRRLSQEELERALLDSMERFIGRHPSHWMVLHDMWDLEGTRRELRRQLVGIWLRRRVSLKWRS